MLFFVQIVGNDFLSVFTVLKGGMWCFIYRIF